MSENNETLEITTFGYTLTRENTHQICVRRADYTGVRFLDLFTIEEDSAKKVVKALNEDLWRGIRQALLDTRSKRL